MKDSLILLTLRRESKIIARICFLVKKVKVVVIVFKKQDKIKSHILK